MGDFTIFVEFEGEKFPVVVDNKSKKWHVLKQLDFVTNVENYYLEYKGETLDYTIGEIDIGCRETLKLIDKNAKRSKGRISRSHGRSNRNACDGLMGLDHLTNVCLLGSIGEL